MATTITQQQNREADAILAENLVMARMVCGITQKELATRSSISRATIAQIESGSSDPRLSTITDLAVALDLPPLLLFIGADEVRAFLELHGASDTAGKIPITASDVDRMKRLIRTGMLNDRRHAARIGATLARNAGITDHVAIVGAAIFSAVDPGRGTLVGLLLGELAGSGTFRTSKRNPL